MWPALNRFGAPTEVGVGFYRLPRITDEQRLEVCFSWQMTKCEQWRRQVYRRRRTQGWISLLTLIAHQMYENLFERKTHCPTPPVQMESNNSEA